ncbi:M48 family metalloprotease [Marinobacter halotolerans]|uniref:M48 family metalloprotease n=1 Tax=Marinobacter halotolerans TaxID=1569211 RepID=UPI00178449FB
MPRRYKTFIAAIVSAFALAGCSVNPVTGEKQLSLIPESQALAIGEEQYEPTQQTQGGRFYLDPELNLYVKEVGMKLARVSDQPDLPYEFVVLNSGVPNAWALPGGKIAINRGLLTEFDNEAQLAAVLGHEIVHAAAMHGHQRMQQSTLISLGVAGLGYAISDNEWSSLIMGGAAMGAQLALAQYSQGDELEADRYGIRYMKEAGYDPQAAVELQKIFVRLSEGNNPGFVQGLFATHPPSTKRVQENQELVNKIGAGGYIGRETYQKKLSYLRSVQPAYEAFDRAREFAGNDQLDKAMTEINEAIRIEPEEAAFYAFRGKIYRARKQLEQAAADFNKATSLYPEMFSYQLNQGLNALALNNLSKARESLNRANEVVPTSIAFLRLGDIAVRQGRREDAINYYSTAANASGEVAAEAKKKLAQLTAN